ncbi:MAG TPA: AraC family transcriptional regulator [Puia sp.]|nr:AraC family transcriptional regulator [Puia sp.]
MLTTASTSTKNFLLDFKKGNMFHVHAFNPHPLLRHCVDSYLIISADQSEGVVEKIFFPQITQSLVFGLDRGSTVYDCNRLEFTSTHFIVGPNDVACRTRMFPGMHKMIVRFTSGGLYKIFQLPARPFINRSQDAVKFLGKQVIEISHHLKERSVSGKIELMDDWLLGQMRITKRPHRNIDDAIHLIERHKGNISLRELEEATFTTKRTLERHFLEQVGLHPKSFSRLVRFCSMIRYLESNLNVKWQQLAEIFGYYDQSHLIHEFKILTGVSPHYFFSEKASFERIMQI